MSAYPLLAVSNHRITSASYGDGKDFIFGLIDNLIHYMKYLNTYASFGTIDFLETRLHPKPKAALWSIGGAKLEYIIF